MSGRCYCGSPPVVGLGYVEGNALFCVPCMHRHRTIVRAEAHHASGIMRAWRERDEARGDAALAKLAETTVERDQARADLDETHADLAVTRDTLTRERDAALARLSRAREALARYDEEPPHYRAGLDEENAWRARQEAALVALRAALTEETTPRE